MKKAGVFLLAVGLLLLLVSSCMIQIPIEEIPGTFVVESSSGSSVEDAEVVVKSGNVELASGTTNESGEITFNIANFPEFIDVEVSKEGYALSKVEGLKVETIKNDSKNIILPELAEGFEEEHPDEFPLAVEVELYDRYYWFPLDTSNVREIFRFDIFSHSEYGSISILVKLGEVPTEESNDWEFSSTWAATGFPIDVSDFSGETPFYVVVYDNMNNRIEKIIYLNIIQPNINLEGEFFVPINPTEFGYRPIWAYTNSEAALNISIDWINYEDALNKGIISEDETEKPDGYKVYRSFNGEDYEYIASTDLEGYYLDSDSNLEINKEVWYAVSSVKGDQESERVKLGSVVPIDAFEIELVFPENGAVDVSLQPTFEWEPSKDLESSESDVHFEYSMLIMNGQTDEIIIPAYNWLFDNTHYIFETLGSQEVEVTFKGSEGSPGFNDLVWSVYTLDDQEGLIFQNQYSTNQLAEGTSYKWALSFARAYSYDFDSVALSTYVNINFYEEFEGIEGLEFNTFTTGNE